MVEDTIFKSSHRRDSYEQFEIYDQIIEARARLLTRHPFWGVIGLNLFLVEDTTGRVKTLATDGRAVYYNAAFMRKMNAAQTVFCYAHELHHCLLNHCGPDEGSRRGNRDPRLWNLATDYAINQDLKKAGIGEFPDRKVITICYDPKYDNMAPEEIYEILKRDGTNPEHEQLDDHIRSEVGGSDGGDSTHAEAEHCYVRTISEEEAAQIRKDWINGLFQGITAQTQMPGMGAGLDNLPRGIKELIDKLTNPKVNWKRALAKYVQNTTRRSYSFNVPKKSNTNYGVVLPGFRAPGRRIVVHVAVDVSGSVSKEQRQLFFSELLGIMKAFHDYEIVVWCFGSKVDEESVTRITKKSPTPAKDLEKFLDRVHVGGGTSFMANWEWLKRNKDRPKALIMLTDGYPCGGWGDPSYCPTLFVMAGNKERMRAPFGVTAHIEDA